MCLHRFGMVALSPGHDHYGRLYLKRRQLLDQELDDISCICSNSRRLDHELVSYFPRQSRGQCQDQEILRDYGYRAFSFFVIVRAGALQRFQFWQLRNRLAIIWSIHCMQSICRINFLAIYNRVQARLHFSDWRLTIKLDRLWVAPHRSALVNHMAGIISRRRHILSYLVLKIRFKCFLFRHSID